MPETSTANHDTREMTFLEHLEVLRWHIFRSLVALVAFSILAFLNRNILFDQIILAPSTVEFWTYQQLCMLSDRLYLGDALCIDTIGFELLNIHMAGQFIQHVVISVMAGIIMAAPYFFWEIWRFIKPALTKRERRYARGMTFFSSLLFFAGILFGYFILTPMAVQFLGNYRISELIANQITLSSYVSTVTMVTFAAAIIFELPVAVYFLSKIGLVTPQSMRYYRKHAFVVFLIVAAIITPPDLTSQVLLMFPFMLLYEVGIYISGYVLKQRKEI